MGIFRRDSGFRPEQNANHKLAMYIPIFIAAFSMLLLLSKKQSSIYSMLFYPPAVVHLGEWWRFLTHPFVVIPEPLNILFRTLFFWWVATPVEKVFGSRLFFIFFLICALGCGAAAILMQAISPLGKFITISGPISALWACMWLFSRMFPDQIFYLMFFIPIRAKYFPLLFIGFRLVLSLFTLSNAGFQITLLIILSEITGAALGLFFLHIARDIREKQSIGRAKKKIRKEQDRTEQQRKRGNRAARPLLAAESRLKSGKNKGEDRALLQRHLNESFDFEICPLSDFKREDGYCQQCAAFTHCLAKEIKAKKKEMPLCLGTPLGDDET